MPRLTFIHTFCQPLRQSGALVLGVLLSQSALLAPCVLLGCTPSAPIDSPVATPPSGEPVPVMVSSLGTPESEGSAKNEIATNTPDIPSYVTEAIKAEDRDAEDRSLDAQRKPAEMLAFFGIEPGMSVAELAAGRGYTTELLARVVGSNGKVFGQNNRFVLERFAEGPWSERLKRRAMANVVRVDRELEDPLPDDAKALDAVLLVLFYHDSVWFETDRGAMNRAVYNALKPGGVYGIVDHSARPGDGIKEAKTLHRIEESVLRTEVEAAGFRLEKSADFLRNPDDTRDWNASPSTAGDKRGQSDRFVLKFVRPVE